MTGPPPRPGSAPGARIALAEDYTIPRVVVGLWQLAQGHQRRSRPAEAVVADLERFVEAGLDTFDCADIYTGVEELLGRLIARTGPGRVQVHTKLVPDRSRLAEVDRAYVASIVERSLARLRVERLDLVQFAWWDYAVPGYVEVLGWLDELRAEGKIRLIGTTNFDTPRLLELGATGVSMASHQVQYSLLDRRPEHHLVELCAGSGSQMLCYGSLAGGFLGESWLGGDEPTDGWPNRSLEKYRLIVEDNGGWPGLQALLHALQEVAARHGVGIASVAARWVIDRPGVAAAIVGARDARHLPATLRTLELRLAAADADRLWRLASRHPGPAGEPFALERIAGGPHARIMRYDLNVSGDGLR